MTTTEHGGFAFPHDPVTYNSAKGMTLRDYFAANAMQGNLASMVEGHEFNPSMGAEWAYKVADAMLKARNL
jgi:hypothetical protein